MKEILEFFDLGDRRVLPISIFFLIVPVIGTILLFRAGAPGTESSGIHAKELVERKSAPQIGRIHLKPSKADKMSAIQPPGGGSSTSPIERSIKEEKVEPLQTKSLPVSSPEIDEAGKKLDEVSISSGGLLGNGFILAK